MRMQEVCKQTEAPRQKGIMITPPAGTAIKLSGHYKHNNI